MGLFMTMAVLQEKPVNEKETGPKKTVVIRRNKNFDAIKEEQKKECMAKLQLEIDASNETPRNRWKLWRKK